MIAFVFYVAAQFQGAGLAVTEVFALSDTLAIAGGAMVILIYTWLGGYWAVSLTDTLQGVVSLAAITLPLGTVISMGGSLPPSSSNLATNSMGEPMRLPCRLSDLPSGPWPSVSVRLGSRT